MWQARALAVFGVGLVVAIGALYVVQLNVRERAVVAAAHRSALNIAEILAEHTARTFEALERTLHEAAIIREEALRGRYSRDGGRAAIEHLRNTSPAIIALGWTDASGNVQINTYDRVPPRSNIADLAHFRAQVDAPRDSFYIAPPFSSAATGRWISAISLRLSNEDGSFAGVVTAPIDQSYFTGIHRLLELGEHGAVTIVHKDGLVLTRVPAAPEIEGKSLINTELFQRRILRSPTGTYENVSAIDGRKRIFGYKVVSDLPLVIMVSFDQEEVLAPVHRNARIFGAVMLLLGALIILGVRYLMRQAHAIASKTALLSATLDHMDQGLLMVDARGKVPLVNRRAIALLDLPEQLLAGEPSAGDLVAHLGDRGAFDDVSDDLRAKIMTPLAGASIVEPCSYERALPGGTVLEVRTTPLPNGGVVRTYTDVTARKRDEERFRSLLEASPEATVIASEAGRIVLVNGRCEQLFGIARADLTGQAIDEILPNAPKIINHPEVMSALIAGGHEATFGYRPDGTSFPIEVSVSRLQTQDQVLFSWSMRDVSARNAAEEALREAKERAEAATRAKDEFLANMSHELRTPLTAIIGATEFLLRADLPAPERRRYLDIQLRAGTGLLSLINDVLDFSKIEAGELTITPAPVSLRQEVENCRSLLADQASAKGLSLLTEVDAGVPARVRADPGRLRQILLNLLSNAIKFTDRGSIRLTVRPVEPAPALRFEVADTGRGIAADKLPLLFERFVQVDSSASRRQTGTGLGLAISKRLVAMMGGELSVDSTPGVGSTFGFALPLEAVTDASDLQAAPKAGLVGRREILLVDDNDLSRQIIASMLESVGHSVVQASNGPEAIAHAVRNRFDIILMDLQMPGMDGYATARAIRRDGQPGVPIIALTANALAEDTVRVREAGMDAHITKPVDWPHLLAVMAELANAAAKPARAAGLEQAAPRASGVLPGRTLVLDIQKRERLRAAVGPQNAQRLIGMFVAELRQRLAVWEQSPCGELAERAHSFGGTAGMLGFVELAAACAALQDAAREGRPLEELAAECRAACRRALCALEGESSAAA